MWNSVILFTLPFLSLIAVIMFVQGIQHAILKKNAFGFAFHYTWLGVFVWGDALILGPFWFVASLLGILTHQPILFGLITSLFWVIRAAGETQYWFLQQFSSLKRNPPEHMPGYALVGNDSVWFLYQLFWQCFTVFAGITSIYLAAVWIQGRT